MPYHPHIHFVVPGEAFSKSGGRWHPSRIDFFLPVKAMSKIFAAKFRDEMKKNGLQANIPTNVWKQPWIVNCQATANSMHPVKYLAAYVFKVAISNSRILKVENRLIALIAAAALNTSLRCCPLNWFIPEQDSSAWAGNFLYQTARLGLYSNGTGSLRTFKRILYLFHKIY